MKLLFHCCCAPCSVACIDSLWADGIVPALFWYNPNIHPYTEYQSRRDALIAFAAEKKLPMKMVDEYGLRLFLREAGFEKEAPERCEICYRLRLEKTAAHAAENGFDAFGTSLLISPYQQHDTIRRIGEEAAAEYGVDFLYRDFRPLFRQGQTQARAMGLYMQKYCGCILSEKDRYAKPIKQKAPGEHPSGLFHRISLITGEEVLNKLARTNVLVFGLGGVGSWCAEALVRSGIGKIGIVDFDTVCASNINRQIQATGKTLGHAKAVALKQRLLEINPRCEVSAWNKNFSRENAAGFGIEKADYVIDAIDSLPHKLDLIEICCAAGVKIFSSMGMAKKIDPTRVRTAGIWETHGCPLARLVRQGLRKRGFKGDFTAVYSDEQLEQQEATADNNHSDPQMNPCDKKTVNGSIVTVTATAGMVLASLVLRDIIVL